MSKSKKRKSSRIPDGVVMAVTTDEYELPVAVRDTISEMAELFGTTAGSIRSMMSKKTSGKTTGVRFVYVWLRKKRARS